MLKQDYIVVGREVESAGGDVRVEFQLYTVGSQQQLLALASAASAATARRRPSGSRPDLRKDHRRARRSGPHAYDLR
jgi:hypothetical protein